MILSNSAQCLKCMGVVYSAHRHDMRHCPCGAMAVDGGMEYLRRLGNPDDMVDISIVVSDSEFKALMEAIEDPSKNLLGKLCSVARVLRDRMGINIGDRDRRDQEL